MRTQVAPHIDGLLAEDCWNDAIAIGDLIQTEPVEGQAPSERTETRVLFDDQHLYIGIRCFDSDPGGILASKMKRDSDLNADDRVIVVLDTFGDRRNGYTFIVNPAGAQADAFIASNGEVVNNAWDAIWHAHATIDSKGWMVEMAIPFQSLSFGSELETWGFNVQRVIKRRLENSRWASPRRNAGIYRVSEAGALTGLNGIKQGLGLDVVPFFSTHWSDNEGDDSHLLGKPGFDAFYRLAPNFGAALTVNTDFAATEVDQRRINLTRFPLFFPEKRDFFLQDAGVFQFADLGDDLIPFFSRRVGLTDDGQEVPIDVGAKLAGQLGDFQVGLLDVQTGSAHDFEATNLFAARVSKHLGEQSSVGGIVTSGDPDGTGSNTLLGLDYNFSTSSFRQDRNLRASAWYLTTRSAEESSDPAAQDAAFGASVAYPNDTWSFELAAKEIQADFEPALGFVPRTGIRKYSGQVEYEVLVNADIRRLDFGVEPEIVTDLDGDVESSETRVGLVHVLWDSGDELSFEAIPSYERLSEPFEIEDDVTLPEGTYDWLRWRVEAESALKRPATVFGALEVGNFFDGERTDWEAGVSWRPSRYFNTEVVYEWNLVDLPQGTFDAHVGALRLDFAASPSLTWSNLLQFDNDSDSLGWNSRVQWILKPGETLNLVLNQVAEREDGDLHVTNQEATLMFQYTLRF